MMLPYMLLLVCGAAPAPSPALPGGGDFRIRAKVVEALEGGPCVVEVEFSYEGKADLPDCHVSPISVRAPRCWKRRPRGFDECVLGGGRTIMKGRKSYSVHFLHWDYEIPAGSARLKVGTEIWQAVESETSKERLEGKYRLIASPSVEVVLDVLPATPKNVAAFCARFERQYGDWNYCLGYQQHCLWYARHPALAALAWRIMERDPSMWFDRRVFELAAEHSESAEVAEAHFLKLADNPRFESRITMFSYWGDRRKPLSPATFAALLRSERLWTRVLAYAHFGKRCEQPWIDTLLSDLKDLQKPIPAGRFNRLLREMDSDSFAAREKATAQLAAYGERAEAQLQQALRTDLALEAKRRVRFILERIAAGKKSPDWKPILEHLSSDDCDKDAARAVLQALAKGSPDAELTKIAIASLDKLSHRK